MLGVWVKRSKRAKDCQHVFKTRTGARSLMATDISYCNSEGNCFILKHKLVTNAEICFNSSCISPVNTFPLAVRWCIPPVSTVPHDGQMVHSQCQSTQYHMAVRWCILSASQHSTTWRSDGAFSLPVNTVPHGGQMVHSQCQSTQYPMTVRWCILSASQHSTTWQSDGAFSVPVNTVPHGSQMVHSQCQSTQYHMTAADTISGTRLQRPGEAFCRPL